MSDTVERALAIATYAHEGVIRKGNGEPYINHPVRVASGFSDPTHKIVALLHDVIEDTWGLENQVKEEDIREQFGDVVADAVVALTRPPDLPGVERETYMNFVRRSKKNPIARVVKMADINDNMRDLPPGHGLRKRYTRGLKILEEE